MHQDEPANKRVVLLLKWRGQDVTLGEFDVCYTVFLNAVTGAGDDRRVAVHTQDAPGRPNEIGGDVASITWAAANIHHAHIGVTPASLKTRRVMGLINWPWISSR
jgi:hypothetical protein